VITQKQFLDAAADFAGLIAEGKEAGPALVEAGNTNGVDPSVLEKRLTAKEDLETVVAGIRKRAKQDSFHGAMIIETQVYWEKISEKSGLGWIFNEDHRTAFIKSAVERRMGRPVDVEEENQIREHFFEIVQGRFA
jgi:hypothetical protein